MPHPEPTLSEQLLNHHITARGLQEYVHADPLAQATTTFLRDLLAIVEQALTDEDIPETTTRRVLNAVIYGSLPRGVDVQERARSRDQMTAYLNQTAPTIRVPWRTPR